MGRAVHIDWPSRRSPREVDDPIEGRVAWWIEWGDVAAGRARYEVHYRFERTAEEMVSRNELRFRSLEELSRSLAQAGFTIESLYGNWDRSPVREGSPVFIVLAAREA